MSYIWLLYFAKSYANKMKISIYVVLLFYILILTDSQKTIFKVLEIPGGSYLTEINFFALIATRWGISRWNKLF